MKWLTELLSRVFKSGVSKEVCAEVQKANTQAHERLEDCLEGAETRCGERFESLKGDMQREFDEVKKLLRK